MGDADAISSPLIGEPSHGATLTEAYCWVPLENSMIKSPSTTRSDDAISRCMVFADSALPPTGTRGIRCDWHWTRFFSLLALGPHLNAIRRDESIPAP